jgi:hypothetical protein
MMRLGVLLPRARARLVDSPHRGHTFASRSMSARQCGHMRTVLAGVLSGTLTDDANSFLIRCH